MMEIIINLTYQGNFYFHCIFKGESSRVRLRVDGNIRDRGRSRSRSRSPRRGGSDYYR